MPYYPKAGGAFRGALVRKAVDQTAANYTTTSAVAWDQEAYDTDAIHDNSTQNTRLTVPAGVTRVRLGARIDLGSVTNDMWVFVLIYKGGSASFDGAPATAAEIGVSVPTITVWSPVLVVEAAQYFECMLGIETDTSVTVVAATSWFAMEIIA
jgi:hypothetical protein